MSDTTALDGNNIDAVAASIIEGPEQVEEQVEELEQPDEGDAPEQLEAEDGAADDAEAETVDEGEYDSTPDADEGQTAEQLYTVKVDGRDQQVPLTELLRGYAGQAYIQKGMREAAALQQALQSERQQIAELFQAVQAGQIPMRMPEPPSEDLISRDPVAYLQLSAQYDREVTAYQQAQQAMAVQTQREQQEQEARHRAYLNEQRLHLARAIPAFAKPETAERAKQDLIRAGTGDYGFAIEELQQVADHRMLRVLHDAAQYRRLMSGKAAAEKQAEQPRTPTLKPGVKTAPQAGKRAVTEKAKAQMKRTGSVDDVARFLLM